MIENQSIKDRLKIFIKYLGIGQAKFEKKCNLSNGYINNSKGNYGASKLDYILKVFPELNRDWLLYGEGEMLKSPVQEAKGDNNTQVIGHCNNVSTPSTIDKALEEIAAQRKLVEKSQEQIDRLIGVLEKLTEK